MKEVEALSGKPMFHKASRFCLLACTLLAWCVLALTGCDTNGPEEEEGPPILEVLRANEELGTFNARLQAADLADTLTTVQNPVNGGQDYRPRLFTIFAPTNEAFESLPDDLREALEAPAILRRVLAYHIIPGWEITADELSDNPLTTPNSGNKARTLLFLADSLAVTAGNGGGPLVSGVPLQQTDLEASNGVIHTVDEVLIPPAVAAALSVESRGSSENDDGPMARGLLALGALDKRGGTRARRDAR